MDDETPARPGRRWLRRVAIGTALLLVVVLAGAFAVYRHLEGNITGLDVDLGPESDRPDEVQVDGPDQPLTVLVIGTDSRAGTDIGGTTEGLSDVTMLLHVSADRSRAYGVSLARDLMVDRPTCTGPDGEEVPGGLTQFNKAYAVGGPACTLRTVEAMTGDQVRIDHFVVVDLAGFADMVDAVGGVTICVPHDVDDTTGNIQLPAGTYEVDGRRALDYVRVRHDLGLPDGDIGRMKRQQAFVASMVDEVVSAGTLANLPRLYRFLDAATSSLTTDDEFANLRDLTSLARSLADIGTDQIRFVTAPTEPWPPNTYRLQLAPEAQALFGRMRRDEPLGGSDAGALSAADAPGARPGGAPTRRPDAEERRRQAAEDAGLCV